MKRFYCVILAMLAVILYAIVMSGCRAISSNVEVATQPVVETPLAEHIGKMRQGSFINDAEEFVRNISVLLEEKSPHDYSVRRIEEILLNNEYLLTQNRHPKTMLQTAISSIFVYINFWRSFRYGKKTFGSCFASHCVDFWFNILRMSFL